MHVEQNPVAKFIVVVPARQPMSIAWRAGAVQQPHAKFHYIPRSGTMNLAAGENKLSVLIKETGSELWKAIIKSSSRYSAKLDGRIFGGSKEKLWESVLSTKPKAEDHTDF
jgi:hypothetical protein